MDEIDAIWWMFMITVSCYFLAASLYFLDKRRAKWTHVQRDHPCRLPRLRLGYTYGSRWRCRCGQIWEVRAVGNDDSELEAIWEKYE